MRRGGCGWSQRRAPRFYYFPFLAPRVKSPSIRIRKVQTSCVLTSSAVTWLSPQPCGYFQPAAQRCNFHEKVFYFNFFFPQVSPLVNLSASFPHPRPQGQVLVISFTMTPRNLPENLYSAINPAILLQSTKTNSVVGIIVVFADFLFLLIHH